MNLPGLISLEKEAQSLGLLLRIQVKRPLNLWSLRLVVAREVDINKIKILGEMKAWAYSGKYGLQLDTLNILANSPPGIGHLIWASTMAWALDETPCKRARLLAIKDEENQHARLIKYFNKKGFCVSREIGSSPIDLPFRMIWGGAGSLMYAECEKVLDKSYRLWKISLNNSLEKFKSF